MMSKVIILEGPRGTGKSTLARNIREKISEITLVNATGFHLNDSEGLAKIVGYYTAWLNMLSNLHTHDSTFVFDRFFFSERVFSELYKDYDFNMYYRIFLSDLSFVADVDLIYLTVSDSQVLKARLERDKVPFGNVSESVFETMRQQSVYNDIMSEISSKYPIIKLHEVDTTYKTPEQVQEEVFKIIKGES